MPRATQNSGERPLADSNEEFWGRAQSLPQVGTTPPQQPSPQPQPQQRPLPGSPQPPPAPPADPTRKPSRRRWPRRVALCAIVLVILGVAAIFYASARYQQLDRINLADVLTPAGQNVGTNYLIVGSDSREGVDPDVENAGFILGDGAPTGQRSDTLLVLRVAPEGTSLMSLPRDLWLPISGTGNSQRINTAYAGGAERVITTVQESLGIPIHHYMEIDFVHFSSLVDALGGISVEFAHPAYDDHSGLNIPSAGIQQLNGAQALAYVRSRYYVEVIDGSSVSEGTGDLGRVQRQQTFLSALMSEVGGTRNPLRLHGISGALVSGVTVDDQLGLLEGIRLARTVAGTPPESVVLPTYPFRTPGGAAVLGLTEEAPAVIATFQP